MTVSHSCKGRSVYHYDGKIYCAMDGLKMLDTDRKFSLDEAADLIDSVFATKVVTALQAKFDPNEMGRILKVLKDAGLISQNEMQAVNEEMSGASENIPDAIASDAMFPHANRLGRSDGYAMAGFPTLQRVKPMSAKDQAAHAEMFPNAGRLKS